MKRIRWDIEHPGVALRGVTMSWRIIIYVAISTTSMPAAGLRADEPAEPIREPGDDSSKVITVAPIDVEARRLADGQGQGLEGLVDANPESRDAARALDDSAFVTVVRIDERAGETVSAAEVLAESMGVHVRSLGGLGSFSSISVRGAASGHTSVLVDGVPLSRIASVSADLGRFSLDSFAELELFRGGVPVELGGAALGGALNLVTPVGKPASGKRLTLSAGGGSFGTRHAHARWLDGSDDGRMGYHLGLGYAGTNGDFVYYDDRGTNLVIDDDEYVERKNNGYDQIDGVIRYRRTRGAYTLEAGSRSMWREQGLPGRDSVQSEHASVMTLSQLLDARLARQGLFGSSRLTGSASLFASLEWQRFHDPAGEIRLGVQDGRQWWLSTGSMARMAVDAGMSHVLSLGLENRFELARDSDMVADSGEPGSSYGWRLGGAVSAADDMLLGDSEWLVVQPALRLDWLHTVPMADRNQPVVGEEELAARTDVFFSPRLAARARAAEWLTVKGSAGRYFREPTVPELFGGRGVHVGNPELVPETGLSTELGVVVAWPRPLGVLDRIHLETAAFWRKPKDMIVYRTTLGGAFNLGNARTYGLETGVSMRFARAATLSANYTWLESRQESPIPSYDGEPLPYAPAHQLDGRLDVARDIRGHLAVCWTGLTWTSGNFVDLAGAFPLPARRLVSAGIKLEPVEGMLVGVEGKNLTDERVETIAYDPPPRPDLAYVPQAIADFQGYPLPGRALYLTVEWKQ